MGLVPNWLENYLNLSPRPGAQVPTAMCIHAGCTFIYVCRKHLRSSPRKAYGVMRDMPCNMIEWHKLPLRAHGGNGRAND